MSTMRHILNVQVAVRSPFVFQGLAAAALGLDASALRDERGRPVVPADHWRGLCKAALCAVGRATQWKIVAPEHIATLFGEASPETDDPRAAGESNRPQRGNLLFCDLAAETMADPALAVEMLDTLAPEQEKPLERCGESATRVKIDRATGAAEEGMLQSIELVAPPGTVVLFRGEVVAYTGAGRTLDPAALLEKAVRLLPAMGALKTAGYGEVVPNLCYVRERKKALMAAPAASAAANEPALLE
ncbi:MAG: hypothetical protein ACREC6_06215, partial [Hyphomicrobiaceae bacterium]